MAKCKIVSHDGDGLYTVELLPDFSIIEAKIVKLTGELVDIDNVEYLEAQTAYLDAVAVTDAAQVAVDAAVDAYALDPTEANLTAVNEAMAALGEAVKLESVAKGPFDSIKARKLAIEKQIARYEEVNVSPAPVQAWCADLSDGEKQRALFDPDDEAGTIELLGNGDNGINIQPHYADLGLYDSARDGITTPTASLNPATYFYNRAMTPGWQKWEFEYRPGIITAAPVGGFEVTLDDIKSGEQSDFIPVNDLDDGILTDVPAEYMNCNELAFEVDDHVIVKTEYSSLISGRIRTDTVIGFVDNPKPCDVNGFNYHPFVVGGTQPGFHDWQNIQPVWSMQTPVLSDVISQGPDVEDWKGYFTDGEKILAQWVHRGVNIYIDGVQMAVVPDFALTYATGDPAAGGSNIPAGFYAAWVTKDAQYIYAIPYEDSSDSRHVLRKTNVAELTGGAYDAGTLPDGWEVSAAFGPAVYTDFNSFGTMHMNESGDEGRSMDSWTHGAKRTPPLSPGVGATWLAPSEYLNSWSEESQLTITTPSAATIAGAGISYQFNGLVGAGLFNTQNFSDITTYLNGSGAHYQDGNRVIDNTEAMSGTHAVAVGYAGDVVTYLRINGIGTSSLAFNEAYTNGALTVADTSHTQSTTTINFGAEYESDADGWTLPLQAINEDDSEDWSYGTVGDNCEKLVYHTVSDTTSFRGSLEESNVTDGIYVYYTDEDDLLIDTVAGGSPCDTGNAPGTRETTTLVTERGSVLLGIDQQDFERIETDTFSSDPINIAPPTLSFPFPRTWTSGDPDPFVFQSNISSTLLNMTGYNWPLTNHGGIFITTGGAKDHNDRYIFSASHGYNAGLVTEYWSFLTSGNLATLDELDNGDGTNYLFPHVANA